MTTDALATLIHGLSGNGRSERIRTSGPYVPNVVLYQAELHSGRPGAIYRAVTGGTQSGRRPREGQKPRSVAKAAASSSARRSGPSENGASASAALVA
jgi:hypothetical protein